VLFRTLKSSSQHVSTNVGHLHVSLIIADKTSVLPCELTREWSDPTCRNLP
jgi:hypothetical protein